MRFSLNTVFSRPKKPHLKRSTCTSNLSCVLYFDKTSFRTKPKTCFGCTLDFAECSCSCRGVIKSQFDFLSCLKWIFVQTISSKNLLINSNEHTHTVRHRDTRPQAAWTSQVHIFELGSKIFEMNKFV